MDMGVFIPIGNNGWLISETSPQYKPSFALNAAVVQKAEQVGMEFAPRLANLSHSSVCVSEPSSSEAVWTKNRRMAT